MTRARAVRHGPLEHHLEKLLAAVIRMLTCPICRKELSTDETSGSRWLPFCSERCRNVDLYRWSEGRYAIVEPLVPDPDSEFEPLNDPEFAE